MYQRFGQKSDRTPSLLEISPLYTRTRTGNIYYMLSEVKVRSNGEGASHLGPLLSVKAPESVCDCCVASADSRRFKAEKNTLSSRNHFLRQGKKVEEEPHKALLAVRLPLLF